MSEADDVDKVDPETVEFTEVFFRTPVVTGSFNGVGLENSRIVQYIR